MTNCLGSEKNAARANVKTPIPQVENTAVVTTFMHLSERCAIRSTRNRPRTMTRNSAESSDQGDFESSFPHDARETTVLDACALKFFTSGTTAPFERAIQRTLVRYR